MSFIRWVWRGLPIVLVIPLTLSGCAREAPDEPMMVEPVVEPADPATEVPAAEEPVVGEPAAVAFEWTETPLVEQIPDAQITGEVHKRPFAAQTVRIEQKDETKYSMQISTGTPAIPDSVTAGINRDDGWRFRFSVDEGALERLEWAIDDEKVFAEEHAYYYYDQGEGRPPMSVNGPWGAALQITERTVGGSDDSRVVGQMKGRVALVMRDTDRSWIAGSFEGPVYKW